MMLLPRQVMLAANKVTKRKEEEKCACDQKWRRTSLLCSIAGFLEKSGFSSTLAVLRSEAKSDLDGSGCGDFDFEEVFGKFFDSSVGSFKANIVPHKVHDVCKDANTKRKRKRKGDDGSHKPNNKSVTLDAIGDVECCLGKESSKKNRNKSSTCEVIESLITRKEKRKKKPLGFSSEENSELIFMEMIQKEKEITDHENQYNGSQEKTKRKRKRTKFASGCLEENVELSGNKNLREFVEHKVHYLKSFLQNDSAQLDTKLKREEKKKVNLLLGAAAMDQVGLPNDNPENVHVKIDCNVSEQSPINFCEDNCFRESESEPKNMKKVKFEVMRHFDGDISGCRRQEILAVDKKGGLRATSLEKNNNLPNGERSDMNISKKSKKRKSHNSGVSEQNNMVSRQTSEERNSECSVDNKETKALQKLDFLVVGDGEKELRKRKSKKQKNVCHDSLVKCIEKVDEVGGKNDAKKHY